MKKDKMRKLSELHDKKNNDLVITPGGARSRKLVKKVGPDEVIRYDEVGTYHIIPKKQLGKGDKSQ